MSVAVDIDTVVIGAGVVGLAVARSLVGRGIEAMVLERNDAAGLETSTRNSGVIHAGIYYPRGSLRARLCVAGKRALYRFCDRHGVDAKRCGKLLVATSETEIPRLEALAERARDNGVDDLVALQPSDVSAMEPEIRCVAALFSPSTGVVDAPALVAALEGVIDAGGGQVVTSTAVTRIDRRGDGFELHFDSGGERGTLVCRRLVIASGHGSRALARTLAPPLECDIPPHRPARGHYYRIASRGRFRHLVYPMPDGAWLGTHLTIDTAGATRFGPDNEWCGEVDYGFDDSDARRRRFADEVRRYWPALEDDMLEADYVGVRPKIYAAGEPVADFRIDGPQHHRVPGLVALYGIESPGLTASLAIGEHVADLLRERAG